MPSNRRRTLLGLALVALVLVAGCSGAGGAGDAGATAQRAEVEADGGEGGLAAEATPRATGTPMEAADRPEERDAQGAYRERKIIRTARVELEVEDFDRAERELTRTVEAKGGFVSDSSERRHRVDNETYKTGSVTLRVPREEFDAVMQEINATGTVVEANVESRDVTDQLVDIEARLRSLRAQRDRLLELYDRANDTEEIIAVERRLSEVQTEIERLEARQQSLERRVALSTITVEIREPRPEPEPPDRTEWYEVGVLSALLSSANGVVVTLRALVVALAYALPYVVVFGTPIAAVGYVAWRRRGRR